MVKIKISENKYSIDLAEKEEKLFGFRERWNFVTHSSDIFFQCSPQYRSTRWFEHSGRHSYKEECRQLEKERENFVALKPQQVSISPKYRPFIEVHVLGEQSAEAYWLFGVEKMPFQRVILADAQLKSQFSLVCGRNVGHNSSHLISSRYLNLSDGNIPENLFGF